MIKHINFRYIKLAFVALMALIAALIFNAVNAETRAVPPTPEYIVTELMAAMQGNDGDRIRAVFADNAGQAYGSGRAKTGDAFRAWLESDIINARGRVENPQVSSDGNSVIVTGQYRNAANYRSAANFLFTVEDGRITNWQMRY
jgi:ketosteroid isomerase-like protein